jgi:hypothetical protein
MLTIYIEFPSALKDFLEDPTTLKVGAGIEGMVNALSMFAAQKSL